MVTIVTRAGKGERLTHTEVDANFTNLKEAIEASTPEAFDAVGDGVADDTAELNAMLAAAKATFDAATDTFAAHLDLRGKKYRVTGPLNMTSVRNAFGFRFGGGAIISDATSGNVLDMTDSMRTVIQDLTISTFGTNDDTDTGPDVGILQQRPGSGRVSGNNWMNNVNVVGVFNKAALVNYGSEANEYQELFLQNFKRDEDAAALHIQRWDTAPGLAFPSSFTTNASGAVSNIRLKITTAICNRNFPTEWTITAVTKTNPAVFSYTKSASTAAPVIGDEISFGDVVGTSDPSGTWGTLLGHYVWEVAAVTETNSTSGTFTLTGVDTSGLTGTYDATEGIAIFYKTGPGIRIVHRDRLDIEHFYIATYGTHGVEIAYGGNELRDVRLHGHVEGDALQAWCKFICGADGTNDLNIYDLDILEHSSHINEDFFKTNATTGKVNLYNLKLNIETIRVTGGAGEAVVTLRGNIFDDPSKYYLYNADITIVDDGYMNDVSAFGHFSGRIHIVETGEMITVPDQPRAVRNFVHIYDDFEQWSLSPVWNTRLGTDVACSVALAAATNNGGRLTVISGADAAASLAANGAMLHGRAITKTSADGLDYEVKIGVSSVSNVHLFVGFTDNDQALETPAELAAGDVITPVADNFVGFLYDTAADAGQEFWHAVSRKAAATSQKLNLNVVPQIFGTGDYETLRVTTDTSGNAVFYRNGVQVASFTDAIATGALLCPVVLVFSRNAATRTASVDFLQARGGK